MRFNVVIVIFAGNEVLVQHTFNMKFALFYYSII